MRRTTTTACRAVATLATASAMGAQASTPVAMAQGAGAVDAIDADAGAADALWADVLAARDAEMVARDRLIVTQGDLAEARAGLADARAEMAGLEGRRESAVESIDTALGFLADPDETSTAYLDSVMGVVDALDEVTAARSGRDEAAAAYAEARQSLADANAALAGFDAQGGLAAAEEALAAATREADAAQGEVDAAQAEVEAAIARIADAGDGQATEQASALAKAIADGDAARAAHSQAESDVAEARARVEADEAAAAKGASAEGAAGAIGGPAERKATRARGTYLRGIDISSYQDDIDLSAVDVDFAIVKVLEGPGPGGEWYADDFEPLADAALSTGKRLGLYYFYTTNATPEEQAERFVEACGDYVDDAALFLDWESRTYSGGGASAVAEADPSVAKRWLDRVRELTGKRPMVYMSRAVPDMHDWEEVAASYDLWVAVYESFDSQDGFRDDVLEPWDTPVGAWSAGPTIWQWSSTTYLPGYGSRLDVDVFYGDLADWDAATGRDMERVLAADRAALADAEAAEADAAGALADAEAAVAQLREQARGSADAVSALVGEWEARQAELDGATGRLSGATAARDEAQGALDALAAERSALEAAVEGATDAEAEAREAVDQADARLDAANASLGSSRRHKDIMASVAALAKGGGLSDGLFADGAEMPSVAGPGEDEGADDGDGGDDGGADGGWSFRGFVDGLLGASSATVALADEAAPAGTGTGEPARLPTTEEALADPRILSALAEVARDGTVADALLEICDEAEAVTALDAEIAALDGDIGRREESVAQLEKRERDGMDAVAEARGRVLEAQEAFVDSPLSGGVLSAPEGYAERAAGRAAGDGGAPHAGVAAAVGGVVSVAVVAGALSVVARRRRM